MILRMVIIRPGWCGSLSWSVFSVHQKVAIQFQVRAHSQVVGPLVRVCMKDADLIFISPSLSLIKKKTDHNHM